ncbi:MAG: tRNA pseudouridine(38-40) synthase TruA [Lachnospiraceae bacterium]|nr:tRNA pseudouridine(38-40) synthase TruA [Lachnospiraceae bacterium]
MRILLTVAYDGTAYHGWQLQAHEEKTIEGVLNDKLSELTGEDITVIGASRTDAGVHAKGNLCVFDTSSTIPPDRFVPALNSILPPDIRITASRQTEDDFHPRHVTTRKTYCYRFYHGEICPPMERLYRHHIYGPVDTDAMKEAARFFIGEHDFASFCAAGSQAETTVRTIYDVSVDVTRAAATPASSDSGTAAGPDAAVSYDEYIDITITGNGFLYNMIRIIAGTLLEVGRGRMAPEDIPGIIESRDRSKSGPTLPACGLCLERYEL